MFTLGVGGSFQSVVKEPVYDYNYTDNSYESTIIDSGGYLTSELWRSIAFNYQLGVHDRYPFGGGVEIGITFEGQYYRGGQNNSAKSDILPSLDFNTRLGFKDVVTKKSIYQHNLEMGWTTGLWLDNGWFIGYTGGWEQKWMIPYLGLRAIIMPTNILTINDDNSLESSEYISPGHEDFWKYSDQKFNLRLAMGVSLKFSKRKFIPDYITPELSITGPNASPNEPVNAHFHVGFRWTNGL